MDIKKRSEEILITQQSAVSKISITDEMLKAIKKISEVYDNKEKKGNCVVTTGMGKAGIIGIKMSATLSSIGIPSYFVSPAESAHGDIGRIRPGDLIICFSNSGSTIECVNMINTLHGLNDRTNFVISIGSSESPKIPTDLAISYGNLKESCIVSKVPSTSTTIMLLIADILSITAAESLGFNDAWFKKRHPGGAIGAAYKRE